MQTKKLADADFETGMAFEEELKAALETMKEANAAYQRFVAILRRKYDAPAEAWTLKDWAEGFVPLCEKNEGDDG